MTYKVFPVSRGVVFFRLVAVYLPLQNDTVLSNTPKHRFHLSLSLSLNKMERTDSFNHYKTPNQQQQEQNGPEFGFAVPDRRYTYLRQPSFNHQSPRGTGGGVDAFTPHTPISINNSYYNDSSKRTPLLSRTLSSTIDMPPVVDPYDRSERDDDDGVGVVVSSGPVASVVRALRSGGSSTKQIRRLFVLISLNVAYSTVEFTIGILTGRVGLVSDAFHLTFGCGLLTFSLYAMAASRQKPDRVYTYGYKRLEVLAAFTNALFLLFMSFSLAVEGLHAFIQDESEHKHYLIVSAVTNLLVNVIGVWFFRNYARINLAYRKAEDMNYHSVCLHVLADSIRSAGLILASWLLSLGVSNAEVICLGLVSVAVFMLVMPLFKTTGGILLQMTPPSIPSSALNKCLRQVSAHEDVSEVSQARFWELVPGHVVGSLSLQMKNGIDNHRILQFVHGLYHDVGIRDFTMQTDCN